MKLKELMETKPGAILVLPSIELEIVKSVKYKGATSGWIDLVSLAKTGREIVLEIEDRKIRPWLEEWELLLDAETMAPITDIDVEVIIYATHRFKKIEGPSDAKIVSLTKEGTEKGKLRFAVFCPEDDEESEERICVEDKGSRFIVYHSVGFVPVKEIQVK